MKTLVIVSGGMDSVTLMHKLASEGDEVHALSFNYQQRHKKELEFAKHNAEALKLPHLIMDISHVMGVVGKDSGSSLLGETEVPDGHYAQDNMKATVVPNRNMMMLSIATARAISKGYDRVAYAAHAGDHDIYPDCRREFVQTMQSAVALCDWWDHSERKPVHRLIAPFIEISKAAIVTIGTELGVDYEQTWSCYKGEATHCGTCGTCVERREAFWDAGVQDPTTYAVSPERTREIIYAHDHA